MKVLITALSTFIGLIFVDWFLSRVHISEEDGRPIYRTVSHISDSFMVSSPAVSVSENEIKPETCKLQYSNRAFLDVSTIKTPPILYSFPGSGNTWCRLLIDFASGVFTGSVYHDADLFQILPGEQVCNRYVSAIKAHPNLQTFKIINSKKMLPKKCSDGNIHTFDRAIFLLRNPFHAIWSEFQRRRSGSHVGGIPKSRFNPEKWGNHRRFLSLKYLEMLNLEYAGFQRSVAASDILVVRYEDLKDKSVREETLDKIIRFIDPNETFPGLYNNPLKPLRDRIRCAFLQAEDAGTQRQGRYSNRDVVTMSDVYDNQTVCEMWGKFGDPAKKYGYSIYGEITC